IAIIGATHGNEFTGVEVCKALAIRNKSFKNEFKTFIANPLAYERKVRYVDSDLNRAYGESSKPLGNEKERSDFLKKEIIGNFDFLLDIHSTTSSMGSTIILADKDLKTLRAACFIKDNFPHYRIILIANGEDHHFTPNLTKAGLTIEVGPIANNIVKASHVFDVLQIIEALLDFDFDKDYDFAKYEAYKEIKVLKYPEGYFIHPDIDGNDFCELKVGDPLYINAKNEVITFSHNKYDVVYPIFINEAAYLEKNISMEICTKDKLINYIKNE
ncbi:MAG: aspartoacylase, partial [Halobacteriovoraceae bacterium]|nr:aspartoacylase [Halobacteriovoraceae bacterium]